MNFRTKYDKQDPIYTCPGDPERIEYGAELDRYGNRVIVPKGKIRMKEYINSHAKSVDLNLLLSKYVHGDTTALMQRAAMYMDISGIPDNINEVLNLKTQAEKVFDILPAKVKEVFGNNVNNWLSNMGTKEWNEVMSQSEDSVKKGIVREATESKNYYAKNVHDYPQAAATEVIENPAVDEPAPENILDNAKKVLGGLNVKK